MNTTGVGMRTSRKKTVRDGKRRQGTVEVNPFTVPYRPLPSLSVASGLMPRRMMLRALKREKLVNGANRGRVAARDPHFPAPGPIDLVITDRAAARRHHTRPGHGLGMHLEGFGEVARAKRGLDVTQVRANRGDGDGVGRVVALEHDAAAVREVLKDMRGCVLVDAHDVRAARLHRGEVGRIPGSLAGRA